MCWYENCLQDVLLSENEVWNNVLIVSSLTIFIKQKDMCAFYV